MREEQLSQIFLQEVIDDLPDDRVSMDEEHIRVIGSSGTVYRIQLNGSLPYMVYRVTEGELIPIDIVSSPASMPLGDILAALTLHLFNDLSTMSPHVGDEE